MKKWIAWLLAFTLVFGLTGCSAEEVEEVLDVAVPIAIAILESETEEGETEPEDVWEYEEEMPETEETPVEIPENWFLPILALPPVMEEIPEFTGEAYVEINGNMPYFVGEELYPDSFEFYSDLDDLKRCGLTAACIGVDLMPTEDRGDIGSVKPSGWQSVTYDSKLVEGRYLYNRCHLIGFQLAGENANRKNLITGTRYLNIEGMLPFENLVADFVQETQEHVMFRVTPVFEGEELVARGVIMEGWSVEDEGESVCFCVFAYNVQPGVEIDYATGESKLAK